MFFYIALISKETLTASSTEVDYASSVIVECHHHRGKKSMLTAPQITTHLLNNKEPKVQVLVKLLSSMRYRGIVF